MVDNRRGSNTGIAGRRRSTAQFFVVDRQYHVLVGDVRPDPRVSSEILGAVKALTAHWTDDLSTHSEEIGLASPSLIVRAFPLQGTGEWKIGIHAEPYRRRPTLAERAEAFGLRPTQYELIRLLMEGFADNEVASMLGVPRSHFEESLTLIKHQAGVKNTAELLAKVSGHRVGKVSVTIRRHTKGTVQ